MIPVDFSFSKQYECAQEIGPSAASPHYYYPGGSTLGGRDGVIVGVSPASGLGWVGTFAFGRHGKAPLSKILSMPHPNMLCVISQGTGYLVDVNDPTSWQEVEAVPVTDVRSIPSVGIVVFASFTNLVAYARPGIKWRTKRLAWDGLRLTAITDSKILGEYWHSGAEALEGFEVDLATGRQQGGVDG